jgi:hypothetical protein
MRSKPGILGRGEPLISRAEQQLLFTTEAQRAQRTAIAGVARNYNDKVWNKRVEIRRASTSQVQSDATERTDASATADRLAPTSQVQSDASDGTDASASLERRGRPTSFQKTWKARLLLKLQLPELP